MLQKQEAIGSFVFDITYKHTFNKDGKILEYGFVGKD